MPCVFTHTHTHTHTPTHLHTRRTSLHCSATPRWSARLHRCCAARPRSSTRTTCVVRRRTSRALLRSFLRSQSAICQRMERVYLLCPPCFSFALSVFLLFSRLFHHFIVSWFRCFVLVNSHARTHARPTDLTAEAAAAAFTAAALRSATRPPLLSSPHHHHHHHHHPSPPTTPPPPPPPPRSLLLLQQRQPTTTTTTAAITAAAATPTRRRHSATASMARERLSSPPARPRHCYDVTSSSSRH